MPQFAPDGVPTIDGCRPPVLRILADGQTRSLRDIIARVAELLQLPDDVVAQRVSSGQGRLENRVGWACSSLFRAGLIDRERRGVYGINDAGRIVDGRSLETYSEQELMEWPKWRAYQAELDERRGRATPPALVRDQPAAPGDSADLDPVERVQNLVDDANAEIETQLRELLQESSPEFFERAVLDVLWAMGYGGEQGEKEHVGRSNDGGIDGLIRQDPLGLQNVYVQAKRYRDSNTVGSPDINGFYGALARRNADRGVFITTSSFSSQAVEAAKQFGGKIILIDGIRLTALMLRYGVGVHARHRFTIFDVDQDFFES